MKWVWMVIGVGVGSELLYYVFKRLCQRKGACKTAPTYEVLFFPDRAQVQANPSLRDGGLDGTLAEPPTVALQRVVSFLRRARVSLDLAVFTFTCQQLADEVLNLHKHGIRVRYIGDQEQAFAEDSQVERLRSAGVAVRCHSSNFLMHHKFAVVDGKQVLCGSLNWTRNGVWGNHENVLITTDPCLVLPFTTEFAYLWKEFSPTKVTG